MKKKDKFKKDIPQEDELQKLIDEFEQMTGEKLDIRPIQRYKKDWFINLLIDSIVIIVSLFGFIGLLKPLAFDYFWMLIIYLAGVALIYALVSLIFYFLKRKLISILYKMINILLLVSSIIILGALLPLTIVKSFGLLVLVAILVSVSTLLIPRFIRKVFRF